MIDITQEQLVAVRDVPKRLPPRPGGGRLHVSAVYRWIQRGVKGVRLEAVRIGGTTYTSAEALQRFADRQSQVSAVDSVVTIQPTRRRQREIDEAARKAEAILHRRNGGQAGSSRG